MTTVNKAHELFLSFQGRSPKQIYEDNCRTKQIRPNSIIRKTLPIDTNVFELIKLSSGGECNYLGPNGLMPMLPLVQAFLKLQVLDLRGAGVDDECCSILVEMATDHPRLDTIHFDNNPNLSVTSGKLLLKLLRQNTNIICITASYTHIGRNVEKVITARCAANAKAIELYLRSSWAYMRSLYVSSDAENRNVIPLRDLLVNIPYPQQQEAIRKKVSADPSFPLDLSTFMIHLYPNYKPESQILSECTDNASDDPFYDIILKNRAVLEKVGLPSTIDLTRLNISRVALTEGVVKTALQLAPPNSLRTPADVWTLLRDAKVLPTPTADATSPMSWVLPPSLIRQIRDAFGAKKSATINEFLKIKPENKMEWLKLSRLKGILHSNGLLPEMVITLHEAVNVCNEQINLLRVYKRKK